MWIVNTRVTRISATVFHKHKYISNPTVTPSDAVVAEAKNLAKSLKGKLPHYLQELPLAKLTCLSRIFSEAAAAPESDRKPHRPVILDPETSDKQSPRHSPWLSTHINQDGQITTSPASLPAAPFNP